MSDRDPTQGQSAEIVRFGSRRFDHIDRTLEGLAHQGKLLTDVISGLSERMTEIEARLSAVEQGLREVRIDLTLQANQIINAQQTAHQAMLQHDPRS